MRVSDQWLAIQHPQPSRRSIGKRRRSQTHPPPRNHRTATCQRTSLFVTDIGHNVLNRQDMIRPSENELPRSLKGGLFSDGLIASQGLIKINTSGGCVAQSHTRGFSSDRQTTRAR